MPHLTSILTATRDDLRNRRADRAREKQLRRELGSYTTPAEQLELDAIISRYPEDDVREIERILNSRRAA